MFYVKLWLLFSRSGSEWRFKTIEPVCILCHLYYLSLCNQTRCADLLLLITKPSTTKWAYTDSGTSTYSITRHTNGGYFAAQSNNPCSQQGLCARSQLPLAIRSAHSLQSFKSSLRTCLFSWFSIVPSTNFPPLFPLFFHCHLLQVDTLGAEVKDPSVENPELRAALFEAWSRSEYSHGLCMLHLELISTLPVHSPAVFPEPLPIMFFLH